MRMREHNAFWRTTYASADAVPVRPAGWEALGRTAEGRIAYDVTTEYDDDCPHCCAAEAHPWSAHDAAVVEARNNRGCGCEY